MTIDENTLLREILEEYPWLRQALLEKYEAFRLLDTPLGKIFLKKATIADLAKRGGKTPEHLILRLTQMIEEHLEQ